MNHFAVQHLSRTIIHVHSSPQAKEVRMFKGLSKVNFIVECFNHVSVISSGYNVLSSSVLS